MAVDCQQMRARMLELLYGELAAPARAEIEAHVKSCPGCRAELAALESTRALARRALAADAPPPRVRAAILQAAAAAMPAPKTVTSAARPPLWARIRAKWTLPTFATIGAVAVFLLASRIFLEPEKTYQRGRQGLAPAPAEPAPAAKPAAAPPEAAAVERAAKDEVDERPAATAAAASPARRKPQPARATAGGRIQASRPKKEAADDLLEGAAPAGAPPARAFAPPPPAAARDEREVEPELLRKRSLDEDSNAPLEDLGPPAAGAGRGTAAPSPAPAAKKAQAPAVREPPAARAERLFAERRWAEAAVAYRGLLRDDPHSPDVARWRQRLATCEAAAAAPPSR